MAARCVAAGAVVMHFHCRDDAGKNTHAVERFAEMSAAVRGRCDVIQQFSTGGAIGMTVEERAAPLQLKPAMATLSCGSVNFGDEVFINDLPLMRSLAERMQGLGIVPELEVFDLGHVANAKRLWRDGFLPAKPHVDFVLGVPGALEGTVSNLTTLVDALPPEWSWSVAGIGRSELPLAAVAIAMGGHVRVGLEDNLYYRKGQFARNEELVARVARMAAELERPLASVTEARVFFGISTAHE
jgi:3-keto-5-aminohexanoate cleavage enzyme